MSDSQLEEYLDEMATTPRAVLTEISERMFVILGKVAAERVGKLPVV